MQSSLKHECRVRKPFQIGIAGLRLIPNWDYGITWLLILGLRDYTPFEIGIMGLQYPPLQGPIRHIDLANELELTTALESIKSLKPCTGIYLPNQKVKYYTWGVGQEIGTEKESINCNTCSGLLPITSRNATTTCDHCRYHKFQVKTKMAEDLMVRK